MTKAEAKLMDTVLQWSKEMGVDITEFFSPNGFLFRQWWEAIVSSMTLEDVLVFLGLPENPGAKENCVTQKMREIAIAHRDHLLQAAKGAGEHAKTEQCVG
ncbi:hypothetical protein EDM54_01495 [Brevibacillus borstelensis]|uniref:hypothetical protein n=1 Tax=Brevibacillus borstelensis TaxID=45462 RepID=UPI00057C17A1|nr:hypothetical protein [Brevibacillus borstelensis]MED1881094.1 hypothetical protein [Brevibacillus borstelensis]MED2006728.1 hypothetical protein [Brevibacillus borstelensis]RNB66374.1 hypothetical protein EDM54_01495 [Brevibacillus borstelensis]GED53509.1 hypothetical protein BBO01nite_27500 [Brevibacillus borstelensis]